MQKKLQEIFLYFNNIYAYKFSALQSLPCEPTIAVVPTWLTRHSALTLRYYLILILIWCVWCLHPQCIAILATLELPNFASLSLIRLAFTTFMFMLSLLLLLCLYCCHFNHAGDIIQGARYEWACSGRIRKTVDVVSMVD